MSIINMPMGLEISPVDGRYRHIVEEISEFFSEYAFFRTRVYVELEYFIHLSEFFKGKVVRELSENEKEKIRSIARNFNLNDFKEIKDMEKQVKHDVKAIEYFLRNKFNNFLLSDLVPMIHFAVTSEDVNNLAYSIALHDFKEKLALPSLDRLLEAIIKLARQHKRSYMLSRTHGQPASPTTFGKEMALYAFRISQYKEKISSFTLPGKLSGSVGNYNAFVAAYPELDWMSFSKSFVEKLGLRWCPISSQILPHDEISLFLDLFKGLCNVLIDLCRDIWLYCSYGYIEFVSKTGSVGSSVMPHKVNPVEFENAEGNLELASNILSFVAAKLQVSRLQRDLSDSTVKRNYGVIFSHIMIAVYNIIKGLEKIKVNKEKMEKDLLQNSQVLSEAYQTILRSRGYSDAYEIIAREVRGKTLNLDDVRNIIKKLKVDDKTKKLLLSLDPRKYTGLAEKITDLILNVLEGEVKR